MAKQKILCEIDGIKEEMPVVSNLSLQAGVRMKEVLFNGKDRIVQKCLDGVWRPRTVAERVAPLLVRKSDQTCP